MELLCRRYDNAQAIRLETTAGSISRVSPLETVDHAADPLPWIAPGLLDVQVNGFGGQEFSSPEITPQKVVEIVRRYDAFGVTRCCPTLFTQSFEVLQHSLRTIVAACEAWPDVARRIVGVHLEGPSLSEEDGPRGAHPLEYCRPPDWDEFQRLQEAADGRIRILTMSVEYDDSPKFIERVAQTGVVVGIGHTSADAAHIRAAVEAGARLSTHLGNGAHVTLPTLSNYLWHQLAEDRLAVTLIVDGHHLPPEVVKTFVRVKTPRRCILISDISGLAGRAPGRYQATHGEIETLADGRLVVAGQRELLAGSAQPIGVGVANVMRFAGVTLREAIDMATTRPAELLGLAPSGLEEGDPADLVVFDLVEPSTRNDLSRFEVRCTLLDGETVWGSP